MIFFRVEAGGVYGYGHAMRSLALARAVQALAPQVPLVFLTTTVALRQVIGPDDTNWHLRLLEEGESPVIAGHDGMRGNTILVIDMPRWAEQYMSWQETIHGQCQVVRLDAPWAQRETTDLLVLPGTHYACDRIDALHTQFHPWLLVGRDVVCFQPALTSLQRLPWNTRRPWLVFAAGASDPGQVLPTLYAMTVSLHQSLPDVQRIYAMGAAAADWCLGPPPPGTWVTRWSLAVMRHASLGVLLWGHSVYEALLLGIPVLTLTRTAEEAQDAMRLARRTDGAIQHLGTVAEVAQDRLCRAIIDLWQDTRRRRGMIAASHGLFDRGGAFRVARALLALQGGGSCRAGRG